MMKLVNEKDYGELPVAKDITRIELIPVLSAVVGKILVQMKPLLEDKSLTPFYCFMVEAGYKLGLEAMLNNIELYLPNGCTFYVSDGHKVFELRGPGGGVTTAVCFYLIAR